MSYLLDTNVISELRKPPSRADPNVRLWTAERNPQTLFLSAITILEIQLGIDRIRRRDSLQAQVLENWLEGPVLEEFKNRILPVDVKVARQSAALHVPDPRPERDALIAATALAHDMVVVTRNISDFEPLGVGIVNPWER